MRAILPILTNLLNLVCFICKKLSKIKEFLMNHKLKLVLLLFAIASSNLVLSQELFREKYSASYRYRSELFGSIEDLLDFDTESMDTANGSQSEPEDLISDSRSSESSEEDITDQLQRENFIVHEIQAHQYELDIDDYEKLSILTDGLSKEIITDIIGRSVKSSKGDQHKFLDCFYLRVFKFLKKANNFNDVILPEEFKTPYIDYLNAKRKLNFSADFLAKTVYAIPFTLREIETIFTRTAYRIKTLKPNESLEQIFMNYVMACESYKKFNGAKEEARAVQSINFQNQYIIAQQGNITQLRTANQVGMSCGYHALQNGVCIGRMLESQLDPSDQLNVMAQGKYSLVESGQKDLYELIIEKRLKDKTKCFIEYILLSYLANGKDGESRIFRNALPNIARNLLESREFIEIIPKVFFAKIAFSKDMILKAIVSEMKRQLSHKPASEVLFNLSQVETIESYFPKLRSMKIAINQNTITDLVSGSSSDVVVNADQICFDDYKNGQWLRREEIQYLVRTVLSDESLPIIVLGDMSNQLSLEEQLKIDTEQKEKLLDPKLSTKVLICFRDNHWISCIIHKTGDRYQYYLVNSLNNQRCLNWPIIIEIKILFSDADACNDVLRETKELERKSSSKTFSGLDEFHLSEDDPTFEQIFENSTPQRISTIIHVLNNPGLYKDDPSGTLNKNLLLYGPPGTGKTTIALRIAQETGRKVFGKSGANFTTSYQASAVGSIENLFAEAKAYGKPCIIFIDEIDRLLDNSDKFKKSEEANKATGYMIHLLDSVRDNNNVFVIATTNYLENIESANKRRFHQQMIAYPSDETRRVIIRGMLQKVGIEVLAENAKRSDKNLTISQECFDLLLYGSQYISPSDLKDLVYEAKRCCMAKLPLENKSFTWGAQFSHLINAYSLETSIGAYRNHIFTRYASKNFNANERSAIEMYLYANLLDTQESTMKNIDEEYQRLARKGLAIPRDVFFAAYYSVSIYTGVAAIAGVKGAKIATEVTSAAVPVAKEAVGNSRCAIM